MKKRIIILVVSLIIITGIIIGVSYAFFSTGGSQETANTFQSGCLNISLTDASASISLSNIYPITDIEGLEGTSYDFTITNTCNTDANYQINLESLNEVANSLSADYIKVSLSSDTVGNVISILSDNTSVTPEIDGAYEAYNLYTGTLKASETKTYHLKLWLDYDATVEQAANKVYQSKINVVANPEIQVVDNLEATFELNDKTLTSNLTSNVTSATYCTTTDNICEPTATVSISNNSFSTTFNNIPPTKQVSTALGIINVYTNDIKMVCTKLNDTSKIICSNPNIIDATPDFFTTSEEADNGNGYCSYDNNKVNSFKDMAAIEDCITIYKIDSQAHGVVGYYDKSLELVMPYVGTGIWDGSNCTYEGNTVYDMNLQKISSEGNCGDIYLIGGSDYYVSMISQVGNGGWITAYGKTGIYEGQDDDGTTYYWRGNVDNNWLYFAGFYWRIIRINGDKTIRIIYNGATTNTTGTGTQINAGPFNLSYNDNAYVGYMFGSSGSSSYNETHANTNNSTIKEVIDLWYQENLTDYAKFIDTNAGFCNDRTPYTNIIETITGGGAGTITTYYGASIRLYTTKQPTFKCQNNNDLFTVRGSNKGNKALQYPIGLITADEVAYAGGVAEKSNSSFYLNTNQYYWTMSPYQFNTNNIASMFRMWANGFGYTLLTEDNSGVRPVINLRSDVKITGSGTIEDPYIVQTD